MRKTVIIDKSNYIDIDMDDFDLHSEVLFHRAENLQLYPEIKEQFYLGRLFLNNGFVVLQISDFFTIVYLPDNLDEYQISIIKKYILKGSQYSILTSDEDIKIPTMYYTEFYDYLCSIKFKNNKESVNREK